MTENAWGPSLVPGGGARFRLWAPGARSLGLLIDGRDREMESVGDGWFEAIARDARVGSEYLFVLEDGNAVPDPAARAQLSGVHGPSVLVDPAAYRWRVPDWPGRPWEEAVICEAHVGTFTPEGTFRAAIDRLDHLAETGFTALELMPVAQFSGNRGWGYDGVLLYAPHPAYGTPDDLRALVDAAHSRGLMVLLDIVYNHFGPEGNYLHAYAPDFFDETRQTPWGAAIAYDRPAVRCFFVENALHWLEEYRLDGFRFDAIDHVRDPRSRPELLVEIAERIRALDLGRPIHLTTEDNRNITRLHERGPGGAVPHYTAEWNDDFHNTAHVVATGETEAYYADFVADPVAALARALAEGFVFQGEATVSGEARGEPSTHLPPAAFIDFLQNHDQTGNRAFGERLDKTVVATEDTPGFVVNRLLTPYLLDAVRALEAGVATKEDIDAGMTLGCGHPMGPLALADFVGLDTLRHIAEVLFAAFKDPRYAAPPLLTRMVQAGYLGLKSGKGFFDYD